MITLIGGGLALWCIAVCFAAVKSAQIHGTWRFWGACGILSCLALALFLRPDEELEAGEDPGSYLHAAYAFSDTQRISFDDQALCAVQPQERGLFRYGHAGFLATKDAVLWRDDLADTRVGPHFFAAYPVLLAFAVSLTGCYAAFLVSPLLALGIGWMLGGLAWRLTRERMAVLLVSVLYWLHPVIIWNARTIRAEWPASLLVIGGVSLWLDVLSRSPDETSRIRCALAGLSIAGAALFHITALYVLLPVLVVSCWASVFSRKQLWFWGGVTFGLLLLLVQIVLVSDPYGVLNQVRLPGRGFLSAFSILGLILLPYLAGRGWRRLSHDGCLRREPFVQWIGFVGGVFVLGGIALVMRFRHADGVIPFLPRWTASYLSLTDFEGVARMMSRIWLGISLLGIPVLACRAEREGQMGRFLLLALLPASMTIGWTNNFLFETRRMLTVLVPVLVLSTVVLSHAVGKVALFAVKRAFLVKWGKAIVMLVFSVFCVGLALRGRLHLYTAWNNRGLHGFYRGMGNDAKAEGDFLLAEYTQTAVPVARFSGLPLLPLAFGYRSDSEYREAERVWHALVEENPDLRFLLVTPFDHAVLPGLVLKPLQQYEIETTRMSRASRQVPDGVRTFHRKLSLYHVTAAESALSYPYIRKMNGSRLGLDGGANVRPDRTLQLSGVPLTNGNPLSISLHAGRTSLVLVLPCGSDPDAFVVLDESGARLDTCRRAVVDRWVLLDVDVLQTKKIALHWRSGGQAFLTDVMRDDGAERPIPHNLAAYIEPFEVSGIDAQWLRAKSRIVLPMDREPRYLLILAAPGQEDGVEVSCSIHASAPAVLSSGWQWIRVPLDISERGVFAWQDITISPAWDPQISGFPRDLGLLVATVVVM
jgi:hypothetical protein